VDDFSRFDELKPGDSFPYAGTVWQVLEITDDDSSELVHCVPLFADEPGG
jgi:hypothetical protein